jgi:twinkle protein
MDVARRLESIEERNARFRAEQMEQIRKGALENPMPMARLLVTKAGDFHEPREVLFDLARSNAKDLLTTYTKSRESYATSPFDLGQKIKFYRKGYTIWSGYPGAGKTTALRQMVCHLLHTQERVFVASLEEHPADVIVQLAGVAFGTDLPTEHQLQWFIDYYSDRLKVWGVTGLASHREIFGTIQKLAKEGAITQAYIDSLMCLDINSQDFEGHRKFANLMNAVTIESNIHLHLVAHPRKTVSVEQEPDLNDVAGGADYARLAHNVVFVRRGKVTAHDEQLSPMLIAIRKQRYGSGFIGDITGWFNRRIRQYKAEQFDAAPTQYLPREAYG